MLINISVIIIVALALSYVFEKLKLPGLLGMILAGFLLGSQGFDYISPDVLHISGELRTAALIVILIRAGLGISRQTLNKIGVSAFKMSFIPCLFEAAFLISISMLLLDFTFIQAGMMAFVLAAVSPAVIVPQMLQLKELGYGQNKEVPTLILAGSSIDDVFAITFFGAFVSMNTPGSESSLLSQLLGIPLSIFSGILIGALLGYLLVVFFRNFDIRDTKKVMLFMIVAIGFHHFEELDLMPVASLLGIMTIGFVILEFSPKVAKDLAGRFNKIWVLAEVLLFTMIGAVVQLDAIKGDFLLLLVVIIVGLIGRSFGVWTALIRSGLNNREKTFCTIAYWPKATVQAAIGGVPLALGLPHGQEILAIAVLAIVFTAPLGAIGVRLTSKRFLEKTEGFPEI